MIIPDIDVRLSFLLSKSYRLPANNLSRDLHDND